MMKEYKLTIEARALRARELRTLYINPKTSVPKEVIPLINSGRLRFFSKHVKLDDKIIEPDDYIVLSEFGDIIAISEAFFKEKFIENE